MWRRPLRTSRFALSWGLLSATMLVLLAAQPGIRRPAARADQPAAPRTQDPAAWGTDHVGEPLPEYMESGECLFCHRDTVGTTWGKNKHNRTIRDAEPSESAMSDALAGTTAKVFADEVQLILGDTRQNRFLKRSAAYGKLELLSIAAVLSRTGRAKLDQRDDLHWDADTFAARMRRLPRDGRRSGDACLRRDLARLLHVPRRCAGRARQ